MKTKTRDKAMVNLLITSNREERLIEAKIKVIIYPSEFLEIRAPDNKNVIQREPVATQL